MDIIQQVIEIITKEYYENLEELVKNKENISDFIKKLQKTLNKVGVSIVRDLVEQLDESILSSNERKKNWYIERREQEKNLSTIFGVVNYKRTYYKNKKTKEYAYLSDETLGIKPHERMDISLKAEIAQRAEHLSYEKTIDSFEGDIGVYSSMTVLNSLRKIEKIENTAAPVKLNKKEISMLYIEADYIERSYDIDKIQKIYLSGDGGHWIKEGLNWIPKVEFVLDKFHLSKYIKVATAHTPYMTEYFWKYIKDNKKEDIKELFRIILEQTEEESKVQAVKKSKRYILGNWEAIMRIYNEDYIGCSAEGHVSHVLSDRLSSRPMGWSQIGADQMARLRVFTKNGGDIYDSIKEKRKQEDKMERIQRIDKRVIKSTKRKSLERLDNITIINTGKKTIINEFLKQVRGL
ncbi:UPF0236 family transposase-like protein [Garciella nitratireducens]|uniref:Uncharacterized protein family (UPF0236) n=1 Tax=Garciella nitratireducens DSM 15102 TaxID=1121911 RepID=A0A1T4N6C1_9FIRM|nr:UPF0236 family protein [Garciella nitratireducens]SJZ74645.1 Uncharacterised protein family (UPF0236) [Garciella nitratireducens DSM 15102]